MKNNNVSFKSLWEFIFKFHAAWVDIIWWTDSSIWGYFHDKYIRRKKWMDEKTYADLVALAQFLPGPASSQVGIGIGVMRAGVVGGIVSFIGFTFPSVLALILFATLLTNYDVGDAGWIHGLKIVAVAVVAHAILGI